MVDEIEHGYLFEMCAQRKGRASGSDIQVNLARERSSLSWMSRDWIAWWVSAGSISGNSFTLWDEPCVVELGDFLVWDLTLCPACFLNWRTLILWGVSSFAFMPNSTSWTRGLCVDFRWLWDMPGGDGWMGAVSWLCVEWLFWLWDDMLVEKNGWRVCL